VIPGVWSAGASPRASCRSSVRLVWPENVGGDPRNEELSEVVFAMY